jgi:hypothetical protein
VPARLRLPGCWESGPHRGESRREGFHGRPRQNARQVRRIRLKLARKIDALELLGKHHRLYVDRHEHDAGAGIAERLQAALARVDAEEQAAGFACVVGGKNRHPERADFD